MASSAGMQIASSTCMATCSARACGRSILLSTGTTASLGLLGEMRVDYRLCLDTLRRVDQQQRALASLQRLEHFVVEVDVPGRVDQVEQVGLAVVGACSSSRPHAP